MELVKEKKVKDGGGKAEQLQIFRRGAEWLVNDQRGNFQKETLIA